MEASFDGGTVVTKPLQIKGNRLYINAKANFGCIDIEILDMSGKVIPGFKTSIQNKDETTIPIEFENKQMGTLMHKTVILRFTLRNAKLYSVWAE